MKKLFFNYASYRIMTPPLIGFFVYVLVLLAFDNIAALEKHFFSQELFLCVAIAYLLSETFLLNALLLNKKLDSSKNLNLIIGLLFILNLLASILLTSGLISAYFIWVIGFSVFKTELIVINAIFLVFTMLYTLLHSSLLYITTINHARLQAEEIKRKNMELKMQTFNAELNPDLLFKSLETLITLVHQDSFEADEYTAQLSSLYRYLLDNRSHDLVTLKKETEAAKVLIGLLNKSYLNRISLSIETDAADLEAILLVPGSIIKIADHIINTSLISEAKPLEISIYSETRQGYVTISSSLSEKLNLSSNENELSSLLRAYEFFTDKPIIRLKTNGSQYVKLPVLTLENAAAISSAI